jgi:AcrR family transcriptional regulator
MNTKNNRRRRESIERIEKAFLEFLQTKELHEITVSDICKSCALNRSTFYANYVDIFDLADKVRAHLEGEVNRLYKAEQSQGFNSNDYLKLFRHIRDNQLFYRTYFKLGYDHQYQIQYFDVHQAAQHFANQHIDYHIEFFRSGFNAMIKKWLAGGCKETPEEMDEIIRSEYKGRVSLNG